MIQNKLKSEHYCFSSLDAFVCDKCKKITNNVEYIKNAAGEMQWMCPQCAKERYNIPLSFSASSNIYIR